MYQMMAAIQTVNMPWSVRMMPMHATGLHCHTHYHS